MLFRKGKAEDPLATILHGTIKLMIIPSKTDTEWY
jgi:hypothetical protein